MAVGTFASATRRTITSAVAVLLAAACTSTRPAPTTTKPVATTSVITPPGTTGLAPPVGASGCRPASPLTTTGIPELRGTAGAAQLQGLVFNTLPIRVGDGVKIVWRMTGTGDLAATATGPDGVATEPEWGPQPHDGSTYQRPGDEWGVGYRFTIPGCWRLHLARRDTAGDVWLPVEPAAVSGPATTLDCRTAIQFLPSPPAGWSVVQGAVALAANRTVGGAASGERDPDRALFAKTGLVVRAAMAFDLVGAAPENGPLQFGWGSPGTPTTHLRTDGCTAPPATPWLVFAGGFYVPSYGCAAVVVATPRGQRATTIGIGTPCRDG
jgi:hypothetical protein